MKSPLLDGLLGAMRRPPRRRLDSRHPICLPVAIIADGRPVHGQSADVGFGGLSAVLGAGAATLAVDAEVQVALSLPGQPEALRVPGRVRWIVGERAGIAFETPGPRALWALHRLFP